MADHLDDDVGTLAVGETAHCLGAVPRGGHLRHVEHCVRAERTGELESLGDAVDRDDARGAARFGDRDGVQPERSGALDDDYFLLPAATSSGTPSGTV